MIIQALVTLVLVNVPAGAKVMSGSSFDAECLDIFYKRTEPHGMDQNARRICQFYDSKFFFTTLYSSFHRIPVYSAYTFNHCNNNNEGRTDKWFIEPLLYASYPSSSGTDLDSIQPLDRYNRNLVKSSQAIDKDYEFTGYDKGHLNPNSYQCDDGRTATFTLTNAAPMDPCFNRVHWKRWEDAVRGILSKQPTGGTAYLVTGTVPSVDFRIPKDLNRVTVPTHVWTAVCFEHVNDDESFSFAYIGENQPETYIRAMTIDELNEELRQHYRAVAVKIFRDDCFSSQSKSQDMLKTLHKISQEQDNKLSISPHVLQAMHSLTSQVVTGPTPAKMPKITSVRISFDNAESWFKNSELLKSKHRFACVLENQSTMLINSLHTELRRRDTSADSKKVVCSLVQEQTSSCKTACLYKGELKGYYCYDGAKERSCSPLYSMKTVKNTACRSDHPCGKYGEDYYWCYDSSSNWQYCSPPLPLGKLSDGKYCSFDYNCAQYGSKNFWCYTDDNSYGDCCRSEDPFSAVNNKTCKPDHPCNYYDGYNYLWCYTTDGSWAKCCTKGENNN